MKIYALCLCLLCLPPLARAAEPVSLEAFKHLSWGQRQTAIDQAPPEQQEALTKLHWHLTLLERMGSEASIQEGKEDEVASERGVGSLEGAFAMQEQAWSNYAGSKLDADEKAGFTHAQLVAEERKLIAIQDAKVAAIRKRQQAIHELAFHLAPAPEALALDKQAKELQFAILRQSTTDGTTPIHLLTDAERARIDQQADELYQAVQKLPCLPAGQAEKERDELPENRVFSGGPGG